MIDVGFAQTKASNNPGMVKNMYSGLPENTIYKYANFYPNGTQLAIAFIENEKANASAILSNNKAG